MFTMWCCCGNPDGLFDFHLSACLHLAPSHWCVATGSLHLREGGVYWRTGVLCVICALLFLCCSPAGCFGECVVLQILSWLIMSHFRALSQCSKALLMSCWSTWDQGNWRNRNVLVLFPFLFLFLYSNIFLTEAPVSFLSRGSSSTQQFVVWLGVQVYWEHLLAHIFMRRHYFSIASTWLAVEEEMH